MKSLRQYILEALGEERMEPNGFIILKPEFMNLKDTLEDKLADMDDIKILDQAEVQMTLSQAKHLYAMHSDKPFFSDLVKYMSSSPCVVYALHAPDDPTKRLKALKNELRDEYGVNDMKNVLHSSDKAKNAKRESKIFFKG